MCKVLLRNGDNVTFEHETVRRVEKHPELIEVVRSSEGEKDRRSLFPIGVIQEVRLGPGQELIIHNEQR